MRKYFEIYIMFLFIPKHPVHVVIIIHLYDHFMYEVLEY